MIVNQIEAGKNLTVELRIFFGSIASILSSIAGGVVFNQMTRIHSIIGCVWNTVNLNFEKLLLSQKPPWKAPDKI